MNKKTYLQIDPCIICLGREEVEIDILDPNHICPYLLETCRFYDLSVEGFKELCKVHDELPKKLTDYLYNQMINDEYEIKEVD